MGLPSSSQGIEALAISLIPIPCARQGQEFWGTERAGEESQLPLLAHNFHPEEPNAKQVQTYLLTHPHAYLHVGLEHNTT